MAIGDLRDAAARAEDHAAALEALKKASADELARRGEAMIEANSAEMNRRAEGAASSMATRLEFALEAAAQELLQRLATEFEKTLAPELDRARGAVDELQSNSQAFEESLQTHQDSLREAAELSLQEAIGRARDGLRQLEEEFQKIGRESQAKWLAEIETKTTDTTHAAFESMFKTADWYEKKVQTQMQSSMEKGIEQAGEELRKKAGEMSGAFATELDHYSRSYVGHSKDQIEELLREASDRVRDNAQQAADGVAANFSERASQIAAEHEAGFVAGVQAAAESDRDANPRRCRREPGETGRRATRRRHEIRRRPRGANSRERRRRAQRTRCASGDAGGIVECGAGRAGRAGSPGSRGPRRNRDRRLQAATGERLERVAGDVRCEFAASSPAN